MVKKLILNDRTGINPLIIIIIIIDLNHCQCTYNNVHRHVQIIIIEGGNHFILWSEVPLIRTAILDMLDNL